MVTRRQTMTMGGAALAVGIVGAGPMGCAGSGTLPLVRDTALQPGRARLLVRPDGTHLAQTDGVFQGRIFTRDTPFRVASISKVLVAELARRLHTDGALDLDDDAGEIIGYPLRHPGFPEVPITLRQLISHQSGIIDPPIYWMAAPGDIRTLLGPDIWEAGVRPGAGFRYSNLNYGLAATVMEAATQARFDQLFTRRIAQPLGLDIGFNWSGVSQAKRLSAFPCLRGQRGAWEIQIDGPKTLAETEPAILREPGFRLDDYMPGTNGTLFSPQGGLRASVNDLARLGRALILEQPDLWSPVWHAADTDGRGSESEAVDGRGSEAGHFVAFGEGLYIYPDGPVAATSRKWVGHHGEAYGFHGGLWVVPDTGALFVHADLGSPPDGSPLLGNRPNQTSLATAAFDWALRQSGGGL